VGNVVRFIGVGVGFCELDIVICVCVLLVPPFLGNL
jgi:hypothetical protein